MQKKRKEPWNWIHICFLYHLWKFHQYVNVNNSFPVLETKHQAFNLPSLLATCSRAAALTKSDFPHRRKNALELLFINDTVVITSVKHTFYDYSWLWDLFMYLYCNCSGRYVKYILFNNDVKTQSLLITPCSPVSLVPCKCPQAVCGINVS